MNFSFPQIETERVKLRVPRISDARKMLDFYIENEAFLSPYDPPKPEGFFTLDFWKNNIQNFQNKCVESTQARFILICKETDELLGMINFTQLERGPFQCCRLGYKLGEKFTGKGLMTESLKQAIDYMFHVLLFHRIEANYMTDNHASAAVLKRAGFVIEGNAKSYLFINNKWQDHTLTSLTNDSWNNITS